MVIHNVRKLSIRPHKNRASTYKNRAPAQPLIRTRASENILEISHLIHRIALNSLFHNIRRCTRCGSLVSVGTLHLCDPVQTRVLAGINIPRNHFIIPDVLVFHRDIDSNETDS